MPAAEDLLDSPASREPDTYRVDALDEPTKLTCTGGFVPVGGKIPFKGSYAPNIAALPGERVLATFEAGLWDLRLLGWPFRYKRRLVWQMAN